MSLHIVISEQALASSSVNRPGKASPKPLAPSYGATVFVLRTTRTAHSHERNEGTT